MPAIVSDIHGNLEALQAVMAHIESRGIKEIFCLGDVVGYGPDPDKCIDIIMEKASFCLKGNHDWAIFHDAVGFNPVARQAIDCVRRMLKPHYLSVFEKKARWNFLKDLPERKMEKEALFVHASPRDHLFEYVLETDVVLDHTNKLDEIFDLVPQLCFVGHTHLPGILLHDGSSYRFVRPTDKDNQFPLGEKKMVINDGSVGQPRDRDNRACYVEFDENFVTFHRVQYNFKETMKKIRSNPCLDDFLGKRLAVGI